jgi:hypothetical protein
VINRSGQEIDDEVKPNNGGLIMNHSVCFVLAALVLASQSYVVAQESTPKTEAEVHAAIKAANPNYTGAGKVLHNDKDGIWGLEMSGCKVSTLEPLRGMPLTAIACADNDIKDLAPLKGMKLLQLVCDNNPITDLSPISGMPIWKLGIKETKVVDLTPLEDMKLQDFVFSPDKITKGIDIVRNMKTIQFYPTPEQTNKPKSGDGPHLMTLMSAENFWKLYDEQRHTEFRVWSSTDGRKVEAAFLSLKDGVVSVRRKSDGKTFAVPLDRLSEEDRKWVASVSKKEPRAGDRP